MKTTTKYPQLFDIIELGMSVQMYDTLFCHYNTSFHKWIRMMI